MLPLVVADRDDVGLVEQDVAGHQHRVGEEAGRDELPPLRLVLELRHPAQLAVARRRPRAARPPRRARVTWLWQKTVERSRVEPGGEQHRGEVERPLAQVVGVVLDRDRVQVDDAEVRLALLLRGCVLAEAADVGCRGACRRSAGCPRRSSSRRFSPFGAHDERPSGGGLRARRVRGRAARPRAGSRLARGATRAGFARRAAMSTQDRRGAPGAATTALTRRWRSPSRAWAPSSWREPARSAAARVA